MATQTITTETFRDVVSAPGIVLIDFWASWCAPCRAFGPVFEAGSVKHPDVVWGKVDTQAEQDLAGALEIEAIPTLMVFRDGIQVFSQAGALPPAALETLVTRVKALDMEDIKRRVAARPAHPSTAA